MDKLFQKLVRIKLLLLDFDGVIIPAGEKITGEILEPALAILESDVIYAEKIGIKLGVISLCSDKILIERILKTGIRDVLTCTLDKLNTAKKIIEQFKIDITETAYIGDDLFDIPLLQIAGFSAAPETARREVKRVVDYICRNTNEKSSAGIVLSLIFKAKEIEKMNF